MLFFLFKKMFLTKNVPYVLVSIGFTNFFICLMLTIELFQKYSVFCCTNLNLISS